MKKLIIGAAAAAAMLLFAMPAMAAPEVIYDALPSISPETNYPSQPFQAQQTYEFGDYVHFSGTSRLLNSITVTMSDWALYSDYSSDPSYMGNSTSWTHPVTLNLYSVVTGSPNLTGSLLATVTQEITIPWRPAGDPTCPDTGYGAGFAWKDTGGICRNGLAFNATFDLSSLNVTLPNEVIIGVAFNTQSYGKAPLGSNGPYNSLNVAVPPNQVVAVGKDDSIDKVFWDSTYEGRTAGFTEDASWTPYGTVPFKVDAITPDTTPPTIPTNLHWLNRTADSVACGSTVTDLIAGGVKAVWDPSSDNVGVDHYEYVSFNPPDGWAWPSVNSGYVVTYPEYGDAGYAPSIGTYGFMVRAVDAANNKSDWSDSSKTIADSCRITFENPPTPTPTQIPLTNKDQCKNNGWKTFTDPSFKNQGDCVSYVQSHSAVNKAK